MMRLLWISTFRYKKQRLKKERIFEVRRGIPINAKAENLVAGKKGVNFELLTRDTNSDSDSFTQLKKLLYADEGNPKIIQAV